MAALMRRGLTVAPYKVGPDYIDPEFHAAVCQRPSYNLDSWLMTDYSILRVLDSDADICVIEGVMGYYDGTDPVSLDHSTWKIAKMTKTPVILVVDASGGAASLAATVSGFLNMVPENQIVGVLVNRVSGEHHYNLIKKAVSHYSGLPCIGYLTKQNCLNLPSRHLGLVPAVETPDLANRVSQAAEAAMQTLDLDLLLKLAKAPALPTAFLPSINSVFMPNAFDYRIGIARDEAFHFYYADNLDTLRKCGMELCFFSPLHDSKLPDDLNGLYIGGGYPEVFAKQLAENRSMKRQIRNLLSDGLPCYAECGGLMYLGQSIDDVPMTGFLPLSCKMSPKLQHFGYTLVIDRTGIAFPGHEFHHAVAAPKKNAKLVYQVHKMSSDEIWACGYEKANTLGSFSHVCFGDRPDLVRRFFL